MLITKYFIFIISQFINIDFENIQFCAINIRHFGAIIYFSMIIINRFVHVLYENYTFYAYLLRCGPT